MILDTFKVEISEPPLMAMDYIIGTNCFGIKYEVGLSLGYHHIVWVSGPWKGAASDPTIAKTSGIKDHLLEGKSIMADKIYKGDKEVFLCPFSGHRYSLDDSMKEHNFEVYSARQSVERVIRRLRNFKVMKKKWTHQSIALHTLCFQVLSKLVNLCLMFEPLDK